MNGVVRFAAVNRPACISPSKGLSSRALSSPLSVLSALSFSSCSKFIW